MPSLAFKYSRFGPAHPFSERHLEPQERPQETKSNKRRERTEEHEKFMANESHVVPEVSCWTLPRMTAAEHCTNDYADACFWSEDLKVLITVGPAA